MGLLVVAGVGAPSAVFWDWNWLSDGESGSTTVRNVGLVAGGFIAIGIAVWRSMVAARQAKAAQEQVTEAQRHADTAQQGLLNERYQKGAEMLGSDVLAVRLGGVYALWQLAKDNPDPYYLQVTRLLCAFARNPYLARTETGRAEKERIEGKPGSLREDVLEAMKAIGDRGKNELALEEKEAAKAHPDKTPAKRVKEFRLRLLNLAGADLSGGYWQKLNLAGASLRDTNLTDSKLWEADLANANLLDAKLTKANLHGANLADTTLLGADLNEAILTEVENLTQTQLDLAHPAPDKPPQLESSSCAETGEPLVWRGSPWNIEE